MGGGGNEGGEGWKGKGGGEGGNGWGGGVESALGDCLPIHGEEGR